MEKKKYGVPLKKLEELFVFQKKYRKAKEMTEISGVINVILKTDEEENNIDAVMNNCLARIDNDNINIIKHVCGSMCTVKIPFSETVAYNINEEDLKITIQFKSDYYYEKCILKLQNIQQLQNISNLLPQIERQASYLDEDNVNSERSASDTDLEDAEAGKTIHVSSNENINELSS